MFYFQSVVDYLNGKGVAFMTKTDYKDNKPYSIQLFGIKLSKKGKFFYANDKLIAGKIAQYIQSKKVVLIN